jgi:hypothetical protein
LVALGVFATQSNASTMRVDLSAFGAITDVGRDGVAEWLDQGLVTVGLSRQLLADAGRIVEETTSLCPSSGGSCTPTYTRSSFGEFDLSSVASGFSSATLVFTRFVATSSFPSGSGFARLGGLRVSGYEGDGTIALDDYSGPFSTLAAGLTVDPALLSQKFEVDVTSFVSGGIGGAVGFRWDLEGRGGAFLLPTSYSARNFLDLGTTPAPYLRLDYTNTAVVPLPATAWALLAALGMLCGYSRARRYASQA